jgi:hypothetical protein
MSNITNTCLYQACTKITNIPSQDMCLNHVPNHQPVPYQTSIVYHNLYHTKYINHAPTPVPNCASTMNHNIYHMPQPSTTYINTIPSTNIVPYHLSTMYLNHIPYHSTFPYTMYHRIYQVSTIIGVPQPRTNITKRCISYKCCHIPCVILNNVSISMTNKHHVTKLDTKIPRQPRCTTSQCTIPIS